MTQEQAETLVKVIKTIAEAAVLDQNLDQEQTPYMWKVEDEAVQRLMETL